MEELTPQQKQDILVFGNSYKEVSSDGTERRIDPRNIILKFNKEGEQIGIVEKLTSKQEDDLLEEGRENGANKGKIAFVNPRSVWEDEPADEDIEKLEKKK